VQLQHFQIKIFFQGPPPAMENFVPFFHKWIQESLTTELLLDVADYSHIEKGPGVLLIGHDHFYSVDTGLGKGSGFLTQQRTAAAQTGADSLRLCLKAAFRGARLVEEHLRLSFDTREMLLVVNDRLLASNTAEGFASLKQVTDPVLKALPSYQESQHVQGDPRQRLTARLSFSAPQTIAAMLAALE